MNHYSIRAISELMAVPGTTLLDGKRHYGLIKPAKTPKEHHLYSSDDVDFVSEKDKRQFKISGAHVLSTDHVQVLEKMEAIVPVF